MSERACDACLARSWLLARLAGHLDAARARIAELLELPDAELIEAVAGRDRDRIARELETRRSHPSDRAGAIERICRCQDSYPERLRDLPAPPAVLHLAGDPGRLLSACPRDLVAVVGSRRASAYGLDLARCLGRQLGAAGLTVISGMALGVDSAAHAGALDAGAKTIAVLAGPANRAYPHEKRRLHTRILQCGVAVSELGADGPVRRWMFPARNRLIAALAAMTVVVEATEHSGALLTAQVARSLGRELGAVPGRVTSPQAAGPNGLLARGARVVRDAGDVLEVLFGAGAREVPSERRRVLTGEQRRLLEAIADAHDTPEALVRAGLDPNRGLAEIAQLELDGYLRRGVGGRFELLP